MTLMLTASTIIPVNFSTLYLTDRAQMYLLEAIRHEHLAFAGGGTVADSDHVYLIIANQAFEHCGSLLHTRFDGGIDDCGIQHLTGSIHHRQLTAVGIAGVEAQHDLTLEGRLHKQMGEVIREDLDRAFTGVVKEIVSDLTLNGGSNESVIAVCHCRADILHGGRGSRRDDTVEKEIYRHIFGDGEGDLQKLFLLASVDGQNSVTGQFFHGLGILVVHGIHGIRLGVRRLGAQNTVFKG